MAHRHVARIAVLAGLCLGLLAPDLRAKDFFEEIWSLSVDGESLAQPILADVFANRQLVLITSDADGYVTTYDAGTKERIWQTHLEAKLLSDPTVGAFTADGALDVVVLSREDRRLHLLQGSDGSVLASYPLEGEVVFGASPFPLPREEGVPIRHGIAVADGSGRPYLLAVSPEGTSIRPLRDIEPAVLARLSGTKPTGPPSVGSMLGAERTDIAFPSERLIAVLGRDGDATSFYELPAEEPGRIATMAVVANLRQNLRTDGRDWAEIVFGVYNESTNSSIFYALEYNEVFDNDDPAKQPFISLWYRDRDITLLDGRPNAPVTCNWDTLPEFKEVALSSSEGSKGVKFAGGILLRDYQRQFDKPLACGPAVAYGTDQSGLVLFFAGGQALLRHTKSIRDEESERFAVTPIRTPVLGDISANSRYEMIVVTAKAIKCFSISGHDPKNPVPISFQTLGGNVYRTGGFSQSLFDEELERRQMLSDRITETMNRARQALDQGNLEEADSLTSSIWRINPLRPDIRSLHRQVFIRRNLVLLISSGLLGAVVLVVGSYSTFRIVTRLRGRKKARACRDAGRADEALAIYHRLFEKFPKDTRLADELVETITLSGAYTDQSIKPLWECYNTRNKSPEVLIALVSCYINRRETEESVLPLYQEAEMVMPDSAALKYLIGRIMRDRGETEVAEEKLRQAVKLDGAPNEAYSDLAGLLLNANKAVARHLETFQRAYELDPDDAGFLKGYCLALIDAKRTDSEAQTVYRRMLERDRTNVPALLQLCQSKIQSGAIEEAVVHAHKIQNLDPTNKEGIYLLSQCYLIQGRTDDAAIRTLREAADLFPTDKEILTQLARTYIQQKRADEEAIGFYRRAWEVNPHDVDVTKTLAKVAWAQKDTDLVIRTNERLMEAGVANARNMTQLAAAYVQSDVREAHTERVLREAIRAEPGNEALVRQLCRVYVEDGRVDTEAMKVYTIVYEREPSHEVGRMLVKACFANDQFGDIVEIAPRLLGEHPDDEELQKIYAQASIQSDRLDDAIGQYESVLAHNPGDREALVSLAQAYAQKGRVDAQAVDLYKRALELAPETGTLWSTLGRVAMEHGNEPEAVDYFKRARKASPGECDRFIRELQLLLSKFTHAIRLRWVLTEILIFSNRLREAAEELNAIFETDPSQLDNVVRGYNRILEKDATSVPALVARGQLFKAQARFEEARRDLERAFELKPSSPDAQRELIDLYQAILNENDDMVIRHAMGRVLLTAEEFDRAIACFQRTAQDYRLENEATKLLGQCFVKKNMLDLALQEFKKLPVDDDLKDILYDLGQRYEIKKDMIGAKTVYKSLFAADISYKDVKVKFESMAGSTSDPMVFEKTVMQTQLSPEAQRRYELIDELGRGAMGIVYKAKDNELDEIVALKILPEAISNNPEAVRRFKIEARSARRLSHPHIIRIHDIGEEMGRKYISMELVEGTDLKAKFRKEGPPPLHMLAEWTMDIASALAYAHRMGIVHRDIKPANIMITGDGLMKVADFGIAKNMGAAEATMTGAVMGTPLYMSPEQVRGEQIDHRADIYSFGIMLYELTTGKPPFSEGDLAYQHINVEPKPIEGTDPRWADLVLRCLEKQREDRWDRLDDLIDTLREFKSEL